MAWMPEMGISLLPDGVLDRVVSAALRPPALATAALGSIGVFWSFFCISALLFPRSRSLGALILGAGARFL